MIALSKPYVYRFSPDVPRCLPILCFQESKLRRFAHDGCYYWRCGPIVLLLENLEFEQVKNSGRNPHLGNMHLGPVTARMLICSLMVRSRWHNAPVV